MILLKTHLTFLLCLVTAFAFSQVTINIISVPANTPDNEALYIAGSFNNWNPGSSSYQLTKVNPAFYTITLAAGSGTIEYKFTRGDWTRVECKADGSFLPNRSFTFGNGDTLELSIAAWEDLIGGGGGPSSTALPNVSVMSATFYMPELNRNRKIWIYLPDDYTTNISKFYPVIYMHDGQNIFDDSTAFAGEWEVDETLHDLQVNGNYGCIVIGIENGGAVRLDEYSPYLNPVYGGGEGDEYSDFIVNTLKPYVDANYRTLSSRDFTAIAGSSMGGLISFYAAMKYQEVFSKVGVFSPSFWFDDSLYTYVSAKGKQHPMRFYFVAGRYESSELVPDIKNMYNTLWAEGFTNEEMDTVIKNDGQHAEWFWAREFEGCYLWLFQNTIASVHEPESNLKLSLFPNPAKDYLQLQSSIPFKKVTIEIFDAEGRRKLLLHQPFSKKVALDSLANGVYVLQVSDAKQAASRMFSIQR